MISAALSTYNDLKKYTSYELSQIMLGGKADKLN